MNGFIQLHRSLLDWEWIDDHNTFRLFIFLLLKANHKDKKYKGETIKRSELVTSREKLSLYTGLSEQNIRTALSNLQSTNEITVISSRKGTKIKINKYNDYQTNQRSTKSQPTANQQVTSNNNVNKDNNDNNINYMFDDFWNDYDNKVGKEAAKKAWDKLNEEEKLKIKNTVKAFKSHKPFINYKHPNPSTYLNQKRFNDVIEVEQKKNKHYFKNGGGYAGLTL